MYLSGIWAFVVFLSTADLLMILRVYTMWNRSRNILCVLLLVYIVQTIITVVFQGIYDNPYTRLPVITARILDFSLCIPLPSRALLLSGTPYVALRLTLGAMLTILAVFQTLKQSFRMYKATKRWQPNRYMQKLVKDGILYFVVYVPPFLLPLALCSNVLYQINDLLTITRYSSSNTFIFLQAFVSVTFYILIPRFVVSIRELYDHDIHGRLHVDSGFGVVSRSDAGPNATVSEMAFADVNQGPEVEGGTDKSGDLGIDRAHGSGLNEDSPIGASSRV
ncbi:hypothetical protein L210DRAFT_3652216 [Boletus edulis BED1]|uniref:Uncharacterized protein n=1 Tax=Boletus edulis BED1 TaxID=1328754 RepID=A0AAD4BH55_BOLED|nr:hypothetical protein L210DRAFT_3652216 [Boletus edulis BED1]